MLRIVRQIGLCSTEWADAGCPSRSVRRATLTAASHAQRASDDLEGLRREVRRHHHRGMRLFVPEARPACWIGEAVERRALFT